jgi:hypothetical protein
MPGLMSGDWRRSTVSGPQRLQPDAWTAPDLSATAPAPDSTPRRVRHLTGFTVGVSWSGSDAMVMRGDACPSTAPLDQARG